MKRKWLLIPVILLLFAAGSLFLPGNRSYLPVMEANWEFSLPEAGWALLYETDSGPSPHGDGWRYHVYACEQEEAVAQMLPWSTETGSTVFSEPYADACENWLDEISVPADQRPDYEHCQVFYAVQEDHSQLLIWWNAANKTVSFAEFFI